MNRKLRKLLMVIITPLPSRAKVFILRNVLNFGVSRKVYIGLSLITCTDVVLESGCAIGHLNVVRGDMKLHLKTGATIGNLNWITGGNTSREYFQDCDRCSELLIGEESSITSRHVLDCTDRIVVGRFTTIAGYCSVILTHGIDYRVARQNCRSIVIGDYCLIGSNVTILKGVEIANRSIVGAGSVVAKSTDGELGVWAGSPARRIRELTGQEAYFTRRKGHVY